MSRLIGSMELSRTVFDVQEAAESELRVLFTLAEIDELWVSLRDRFTTCPNRAVVFEQHRPVSQMMRYGRTAAEDH